MTTTCVCRLIIFTATNSAVENKSCKQIPNLLFLMLIKYILVCYKHVVPTFIKLRLSTELLMNTLRNVVFSTKKADHRYRKLINYALTRGGSRISSYGGRSGYMCARITKTLVSNVNLMTAHTWTVQTLKV
jgi:hypothetical protein